jgi:hypothetical protein
MRAALLLTTLTAALLSSPLSAEAQEAKVKLPEFAPSWKVGDWWVVQTYVRDLKAAVTGRPEMHKPELPGWPRLRGGAPKGFKKGERFRFEVTKADAILSDLDDEQIPAGVGKDGPDEAPEPPELYYQVTVTVEGAARKARLLYAVSDLALGEIEYDLGSDRKTRIACQGTCVMNSPASRSFGFPFDWPDLIAAGERKEASLEIGRQKIIQRCSRRGQDQLWTSTLREDSKRSDGVYEANQTWVPGEPFWTSHASHQIHARLIDRSAKAKESDGGKGKPGR